MAEALTDCAFSELTDATRALRDEQLRTVAHDGRGDSSSSDDERELNGRPSPPADGGSSGAAVGRGQAWRGRGRDSGTSLSDSTGGAGERATRRAEAARWRRRPDDGNDRDDDSRAAAQERTVMTAR